MEAPQVIDPVKDALSDWWLWRMPSERLRLRGAAVMGPNAPAWERRQWESRKAESAGTA
jgi:hypothetical protein